MSAEKGIWTNLYWLSATMEMILMGKLTLCISCEHLRPKTHRTLEIPFLCFDRHVDLIWEGNPNETWVKNQKWWNVSELNFYFIASFYPCYNSWDII